MHESPHFIFTGFYCCRTVFQRGVWRRIGLFDRDELFRCACEHHASTALLLNIFVSSISFANYHKAGHFRSKLLVPFLITSIPAAFLGGRIELSSEAYSVLLYSVLTYLALRMVFFPTITARRPIGLLTPFRFGRRLSAARGSVCFLKSRALAAGYFSRRSSS